MNTTGSAAGVQLPYKTYKNHLGTEYHVIDLDNTEVCPRTGSIIFEATKRKNETRANEVPFRACQDKLTQVWIGIFQGFKKNGDPIWMPIYLDRQKLFNRELRDDAQKAAVLLRSNIVEGSPNCSDLKYLRLFRVHDPEKAAHLKIQKVQAAARAIQIASGLYGDDLTQMARILGIDTEHTNANIVLGAVLERAHSNPNEFITAYENPNRQKLAVFHTAYQKGIITYKPLEGYFFYSTALGTSENEACRYFEKYPEVLTQLESLCKQRDADTKVSMSTYVTHDDSKSKLAEMEAKLAQMTKLLAEKEEDSEYNSLIKTAKELGVHPIHVYKDTPEGIAKLKTKIEEKQTV